MTFEVQTETEQVSVAAAVPHRGLAQAPGLIALTMLVLVGWIAFWLDVPPRPLAQEESSGFSAGRALKHLEIIAGKPHPAGSPQHDVVRDYILQTLSGAGYSPTVQHATGTNKWAGTAGAVENVIARLEGSEGGKALLLVAHYDSVPWGPGAADDGAAVAALLEVARLLKSRPPLQRPILFLFSDGEETGLLGARAFVVEHPWARDVGVVLNFEARGSRGPVVMFETSNQNGWLVSSFAHGSSRPFANSLAYEIYKLLPNDTDFTVFKASGYSGLNFAFFDGLSNYHTTLDSTAHLDAGSLQNHGDYALELAEQFGTGLAEVRQSGNAIYFDLFGRVLVRYSYLIAVLLFVFAGGLLAAVWSLAFARTNARRELLKGTTAVLVLVAGSILGAGIIAWLVSAIASAMPQIRLGLQYHPGIFVLAYAAIALAFGCELRTLTFVRVDPLNVTMGAMLVWFVLTFITIVFVPGASFVFLWPLLFSLSGWLIVLKRDNYARNYGKAILTIAAIPAVLLLVPLLHKIVAALTIGSNLVVALFLALLLALMPWITNPGTLPRRWQAPSWLAISGLALLASAAIVSFSDKTDPRQDSLFHCLSGDTGEQVWASYDDRPDQWSAQFFAKGATRAALPDFLPAEHRRFLQAPANLPPVPAPTLAVLEDKKAGGVRHLRLRLTSGRGAPALDVYVSLASPLSNLTVNGVKSELRRVNSGLGVMHYYALPKDGVELAFDVGSPGTVNLQVEDISYGLAEELRGSFGPRPPENIPYPARLNDARVVLKSFPL